MNNYNTYSLYFILSIIKPFKNLIHFAMLLSYWISVTFMVKYGTNLLLFAQIYQILIQFNHYTLKQLILNVIKRFLTMIAFILIHKTFPGNFLFVVKAIFHCHHYIRVKTAQFGLFYVINDKFSWISTIISCIWFSASNVL